MPTVAPASFQLLVKQSFLLLAAPIHEVQIHTVVFFLVQQLFLQLRLRADFLRRALHATGYVSQERLRLQPSLLLKPLQLVEHGEGLSLTPPPLGLGHLVERKVPALAGHLALLKITYNVVFLSGSELGAAQAARR